MYIPTNGSYTKLVPPQLRDFIIRARLTPPSEWLNGQYRLTTMVAPAGYSKSTVMSQWFREASVSKNHTAWLSLEESDNDPARLVAGLIYSMRRSIPVFGQSVISQLEGESSLVFEPILESFLAEIPEHGFTFIFIDDFHLLIKSKCHQMVEWLIANAPLRLLFVIGSRNQPPIEVDRMQLQNTILQLSTKDLCFTEKETQQFVNELTDLALETSLIKTLWQSTEGWPAALRLAVLSIRDVEDPHAFIHSFNGGNRHITDYLGNVVLLKLPEKLRDFMLRTSVLGRVCGDLCVEVIGEHDSQAMLEDIESRNLFLLPLDQDRKWYRYHHLFAEFLRNKFDINYPGKSSQLLERAAQWSFDQGFHEEAIRYALEGKHYEIAAKWIAGCVEELVQQRGEHTSLLNWIAEIPEEILSKWVNIRINYAWSLGFNRNFQEAENELKKLEAYRDQLREQGVSETSQLQITQINREVQLQRCVNSGLQDKPVESRITSDTWLQTWEDASWFQKGVVGVVLGFACKCTSEFDLGDNSLCAARDALVKSKSHYVRAWGEMVHTVLLAKQGRHSDAMDVCLKGLSYVTHTLGYHSHASRMLSALLAAMYYERDEITKSRNYLKNGLLYIQQQGSVDSAIAGYVTAARLNVIDNNLGKAFEVLDDGMALGRSRDLPRLTSTLLDKKICISLLYNNLEQAVQLAKSEEFLTDYSPLTNQNIFTRLSDATQARIALAQNKINDCLEILDKSIHRAKQLKHQRKLVELLILEAQAKQANKNTKAAQTCLIEAINIAAPEQYLRVFIDEGSKLKPLLTTLCGKNNTSIDDINTSASIFRQKLALKFGITSDSESENLTSASLIEPITPKELSILKLLNAGKSNQSIADSMFITIGTVKWHLHNIFGKLGVKNRTQAIAKARAFGLIT